MNLKYFTPALEAWFAENGRHSLPWRQDFDPYRVWVSEIMLQQTQVPRVAGTFYPNFLEKFPNLESLAASNWEEVYPVWKGLGYYSRGKNMLKTAQIVVQKFGGVFPNDIEDLKNLPGIGSYTAAAICSFAYDVHVPALDTNLNKIFQVLAPNQATGTIAQELISQSQSGRNWNGAMMDLATALRSGQEITGELGKFFPENIRAKFLPTRKPKTKKPVKKKSRKKRIEVGVACIYKDGKYLIQTRPEDKSFTGQWEFPGGKREKGEDFRGCVKREIMEEIGIEVSVRPHFFEEIHEFEHVDLVLRFHRCQIQTGEPKPLESQELSWAAPTEFDQIEFLKTNAKALQKLKEFRT